MKGKPLTPVVFGVMVGVFVLVGLGGGYAVGGLGERTPAAPSTRTSRVLVTPSSSTTVASRRSVLGLECPAVGTVEPLEHPAFLYGIGVDQVDLENLRLRLPLPLVPKSDSAVLQSAVALKDRLSRSSSTSVRRALSSAAASSTVSSSVPPRRGVILIDGLPMPGLGEVLNLAATQQHTVIFLRPVSAVDGLAPGQPVAELVNEDAASQAKVLAGFPRVVAAFITRGDQACSSVGPTESVIPTTKEARGGQ